MMTGTLRFVDIETGAWQLVTAQGSYQLMFSSPPRDLKSLEGKTVEVKGNVRRDLMSTSMVGTILEVESIRAQS